MPRLLPPLLLLAALRLPALAAPEASENQEFIDSAAAKAEAKQRHQEQEAKKMEKYAMKKAEVEAREAAKENADGKSGHQEPAGGAQEACEASGEGGDKPYAEICSEWNGFKEAGQEAWMREYHIYFEEMEDLCATLPNVTGASSWGWMRLRRECLKDLLHPEAASAGMKALCTAQEAVGWGKELEDKYPQQSQRVVGFLCAWFREVQIRKLMWLRNHTWFEGISTICDNIAIIRGMYWRWDQLRDKCRSTKVEDREEELNTTCNAVAAVDEALHTEGRFSSAPQATEGSFSSVPQVLGPTDFDRQCSDIRKMEIAGDGPWLARQPWYGGFSEACRRKLDERCDWLSRETKLGQVHKLVGQPWFSDLMYSCKGALHRRCAWLKGMEKSNREWLVRQPWHANLAEACDAAGVELMESCAKLRADEYSGKRAWLESQPWYRGLKHQCAIAMGEENDAI